jgi:phosphohistidine swiveling domain-containing protein
MKPYRILGIRNRPMLESYGLLSSYCRPIAGSNCMIEKTIEVGRGTSVLTCYEVEDRDRLKVLLEKEVREGKYTQDFFDAIDKTYNDTVQDIKSFWKQDFTRATNSELATYFERFFEIYITTLHPMVLAHYMSDLEGIFEAELKEILRSSNLTPEEESEYKALLLTPTRLTTVQKEEQALVELERTFATTYPDGDLSSYQTFTQEPETQARLQSLAETVGWFHMEYLGEAKTAEEYQQQVWNRIEELTAADVSWKDQTSPKERLEDLVARQKDFFRKNATSEFFRQLVFAIQEFLIVLDYSKADLVQGLYCARPLLEEIGKRVGLPSWIDVRYLLPKEIHNYLERGATTDASFVAERKKGFCFVLENRSISTYFGEEGLQKVGELLEEEVVPENIRKFRGQSAYPGKVEGEVCIVTSSADRAKFKKGLILVTRDTTTELTSVIKQAIAIVADQGSLLSHAAIVSREFKIPCIVQARIATKVLKDGDMVEVDANKGVVRILS